MNNSQLTTQQKELKERLEEIRRKRNADASPRRNTQKQTSRRNEGSQRKTPQTSEQAQTSNSPTPPVQNERKSKTTQSRVSEKRKTASSNKKQQVSTRSRKRTKKPLINQLTNADSLSNAIILNEVVSKPIALRNRNR